jgi:hypothetical protein
MWRGDARGCNAATAEVRIVAGVSLNCDFCPAVTTFARRRSAMPELQTDQTKDGPCLLPGCRTLLERIVQQQVDNETEVC